MLHMYGRRLTDSSGTRMHQTPMDTASAQSESTSCIGIHALCFFREQTKQFTSVAFASRMKHSENLHLHVTYSQYSN